jgi:hypothetical protein
MSSTCSKALHLIVPQSVVPIIPILLHRYPESYLHYLYIRLIWVESPFDSHLVFDIMF